MTHNQKVERALYCYGMAWWNRKESEKGDMYGFYHGESADCWLAEARRLRREVE